LSKNQLKRVSTDEVVVEVRSVNNRVIDLLIGVEHDDGKPELENSFFLHGYF